MLASDTRVVVIAEEYADPAVRDAYHTLLDELTVVALWAESPEAVKSAYAHWATGVGLRAGASPPTVVAWRRPRVEHGARCSCGRCAAAWNKEERAKRLAAAVSR